MKPYRMNAVMTGVLYFLGTVFGVVGAAVGGEVFVSIVSTKPLTGVDILSLVAADSTRLTGGAFFTLLMGISLVAMTAFLYPVIRNAGKELALGVVLFRGALEGTHYFIVVLTLSSLVALGNQSSPTGANTAALQAMCNFLYRFLDLEAPVGSIFFLIGAACLYVSFYRTRLIPRWLSVWGMIGVAPYMAYALLHFFHLDSGVGFYLQMVLAPQELVMAVWLIVKGFNPSAIASTAAASRLAFAD